MSEQIGSGYLGSSDIMTSVANQELIPPPSVNWTIGYKLYKLDFENEQDCHVIINGGNPIFIPAGKGFNTSYRDALIRSFVILDSGITYNWVGAY